MNLDDLELTIRSNSSLKKVGIKTVEDLVSINHSQLRLIAGLGEKSISEICFSCLELLSGRLTERRIEFESNWPSRPDNWRDISDKAKKYDQIIKITKSNNKFADV